MTTEHHPDSLAALKATFRADLEQAQSAREAAAPARRRRVRVLRVAGGASVAALAASVVVLGVGVGGGPVERLDVAAAAEAALAPKPGIQHLRLLVSNAYEVDGKPMEFQDGQTPPEGATLMERWGTQEFGTSRTASTSPAAPGQPSETFVSTFRAGPTGKRDDTAKTYSTRDDTMEIITRVPKSLRKYDTGGGLHWGAYGKGTRLEDLRTMLADGKLLDRGVATVRGQATRRLVGEVTYPDALPQTFEFYVDAATFKPVRVVQVFRMDLSRSGGTDKLQTTTTTIDFEVYEHLPATPENEKLLDFTPPAGTTTTVRRYRENPRDAKKRHETKGFDPDELAAAGSAPLTK